MGKAGFGKLDLFEKMCRGFMGRSRHIYSLGFRNRACEKKIGLYPLADMAIIAIFLGMQRRPLVLASLGKSNFQADTGPLNPKP